MKNLIKLIATSVLIAMLISGVVILIHWILSDIHPVSLDLLMSSFALGLASAGCAMIIINERS